MNKVSMDKVMAQKILKVNRKNGKFPSFTTARLQAFPTGIVGRAGLA